MNLSRQSERAVMDACRDFMEWRYWRQVRMQRTVVPGAFQAGEPGIPDALYLRYLKGGVCLALWCEYKAPGASAKHRCQENAGTRRRCTACDQAKWQAREEKRGAVVWQIDSFDEFQKRYQASYAWLHGPGGVGQSELFFGANP